MPSPVWIWAMICWWTVVVGCFIGYTMAKLGQIANALSGVVYELYDLRRCPTCAADDEHSLAAEEDHP